MNNENSIQQLTDLQKELGYKQGELSTVAMLGLLGEAGEVLAEIYMDQEYKHHHSQLLRRIDEAVGVCYDLDDFKKTIRKQGQKIEFVIPEVSRNLFDQELADVFYYLNILAMNRNLTVFDLAKMGHDKVRAKQAAGGSSEDPKPITTI